jgi:tRNA(fMet)-specific endonuclease VapC
MILLDTDHLTVLKYPENPQCLHLKARMATSIDPVFALTIVTAEEQLRGWLAEINRQRTPRQQIPAYLRLRRLLEFLRPFPLIDFDEPAATEFERLRKAKVRIGSMDLKIGCIALVHNVLLLSANLRDFEQVPNLHVENWLKE